MMSKKKPGLRKASTVPPKAEPQQDSAKASFDDRAFLASVRTGRSSTTFQPGQIIYRQGDPADAVHYIESGKIRLTVVSEHGKEAVIAMLDPG
jgi:CRP-like cAMP-binding protein